MTVDDLAAVKHSNPLKEKVTLDSKQEKLYLILTYAVAFDRYGVHCERMLFIYSSILS